MWRKGIFSYCNVQDREKSSYCLSPLTCGCQHFRGTTSIAHPCPPPGPVPTSTQGHKPQWGHSRATLQLPTTLPCHRPMAQPQSIPREVLSAPSAMLLAEWRGRTGCRPCPNGTMGSPCSPYPQFLRKQNGFLIVLAIRKCLQLFPQSNSCGGQHFESGPEDVQEMAVSESGVGQHNSLQASVKHPPSRTISQPSRAVSLHSPL